MFPKSYMYYSITGDGEKASQVCFVLLVAFSSQGRHFVFPKTSANFLGKYFRINPRKKKKLMLDA